MPSLAELQQAFLQAFYEQDESLFTRHIEQTATLPSSKRYAIYHGSVTEGMGSTLRDTYEVCEKLVGEKFFNILAYSYVSKNPSDSADIANYGDSFAEFVANFPSAQQLPYLADVCRLCWCHHLAYRILANDPFDIEAYAGLSDAQQAQVIFQLPDSAFLLESPYPLTQIWNMCHAEQESETINLNNGGVKLMIWRKQNKVAIDELNEDEWLLMNQIALKVDLENLHNLPLLKSINMTDLLPDLLRKGWLAGWVKRRCIND